MDKIEHFDAISFSAFNRGAKPAKAACEIYTAHVEEAMLQSTTRWRIKNEYFDLNDG